MNKIIIIIVALLVIISGGFFAFYFFNVNATFAKDEEVVVKIEKGSGSVKIAKILKDSKVINNDFIFKLYCKFNKIDGLKAGTYKLNKRMNYNNIIKSLKEGSKYNPDLVSITFLEGKNMRWIAKTIAQNTNNIEDQVFNLLKDKNYLMSLTQKYWFIGNEILDDRIYYPLEGYLFPDTYKLDNKDVSVDKIFGMMLDRMDKVLTK